MSIFGKYGRKARTAIVYVLALHVVRVLGEIFLPNVHAANLIRGCLYRPFMRRCGRKFALASGCIINGIWNLEVGDDVYIAHNVWINATGGLRIGDDVIVSPNVVIATTAHDRKNGRVALRLSRQAEVMIGDGAWVASNSVITKGSAIGEGAVVGAGSVIFGVLEPNCLYAGNPPRKIRQLDD